MPLPCYDPSATAARRRRRLERRRRRLGGREEGNRAVAEDRAQTTDKGAVASRTADGEFLAGVGKRGNLAPAHGLPSPHKYDDAVRV